MLFIQGFFTSFWDLITIFEESFLIFELKIDCFLRGNLSLSDWWFLFLFAFNESDFFIEIDFTFQRLFFAFVSRCTAVLLRVSGKDGVLDPRFTCGRGYGKTFGLFFIFGLSFCLFFLFDLTIQLKLLTVFIRALVNILLKGAGGLGVGRVIRLLFWLVL